jgi:hypothetical protein
MKKKLLNEITRMKDLVAHERGSVIYEKNMGNLIKTVLTESSYLPCVQNGDGLCKIKCEIKQAKKGCPKSREVQEIQHALAKEGMYKGEGGGMSPECANKVEACDGIFDWRTKKAVEEYQEKYGLTPDGSVGVKTISKLFPNLKCDCEKEGGQYSGGERDGGRDIDGDKAADIDYCNKIKNCLYHITEKKSIDGFLKCIGYDNITIGGKSCLIPCSDYPLTPVETEACKRARYECACNGAVRDGEKASIYSQSCQAYIKSKCIQDLESYHKVTACGEYKVE